MSVYRLPLPTVFQTSFPAASLRSDMERVMDGLFTSNGTNHAINAEAREDATGFTLELEVPGINADALEVLAEDGVLTVRGSRPNRELAEGERVLFAERANGEISRKFRLPKTADLSAISASYANGVLTVRVAKIAPAQPRRVTVNVAQ